MAARGGSMLAMAGSGFGGAYLYNNKDMLQEMLVNPNGATQVPQDMNKLQEMVSTLARQVDTLSTSQRHSHSYLVQTSQPTSMLGVPMWKLVALAGTAGTIYWKVHGYELRDLVYVSKRNFATVTDALKEQLGVLDDALKTAKQELLERVGLVETKIDDAQQSIESKIASEMAKVDDNMNDLSANLDRVDERLGLFHDEFREVKEASDNTQRMLRGKMTDIDTKIDGLNRTTHSRLSELTKGLDKQSRGIGLLCEFVCQSSLSGRPPVNTTEPTRLLEELQDYAVTERGDRTVRAVVRSQSDSRLRKQKGLAGLAAPTITAN